MVGGLLSDGQDRWRGACCRGNSDSLDGRRFLGTSFAVELGAASRVLRIWPDPEDGVATGVGVVADVAVVEGAAGTVGCLEDSHSAVAVRLRIAMVGLNLVRAEVVEVVALVLAHSLLLALEETTAVLLIKSCESSLEVVADGGLGTNDGRGKGEDLEMLSGSCCRFMFDGRGPSWYVSMEV